ncbi:MAG: hypothetical protein ACRD2B_07545 [Terriglobia bacterium]
MNPNHVTVTDFSDETLRELIAALEASTEFEHLVYRESELDAVWSIAGFALKDEPNAARRDAIARLRDTAHVAHDLVGERRPGEAADKLKGLLMFQLKDHPYAC